MIAIQIEEEIKKLTNILKSMSGTEESYGRLWNKRAELISQLSKLNEVLNSPASTSSQSGE
jgi:hypothetical protein